MKATKQNKPCTCDANDDSVQSCERHGETTTFRSIPDLWEIAHLEEIKGYTLGGKSARDMIIETWHLAHDLRKSNTALLGALQGMLEWARRVQGPNPGPEILNAHIAIDNSTKATGATL